MHLHNLDKKRKCLHLIFWPHVSVCPLVIHLVHPLSLPSLTQIPEVQKDF